MPLDLAIADLPAVAILRGLVPARAEAVAEILFAAGLRIIEVPLNSPEPFASIRAIAATLGDRAVIGGGTVLTPDAVAQVRGAGGRLAVAPNTDAAVITAARACGMIAMPGFATASEAFAAIGAGATALKLFPASTYGPGHLKALRAVLPGEVSVYPVGGVRLEELSAWLAAGAAGFGFGTELFRPDYADGEIAERAQRVVASLRMALAEAGR